MGSIWVQIGLYGPCELNFTSKVTLLWGLVKNKNFFDFKIRLAGKWIWKTDLGSKKNYSFWDSFEFFGQYTFTWVLTPFNPGQISDWTSDYLNFTTQKKNLFFSYHCIPLIPTEHFRTSGTSGNLEFKWIWNGSGVGMYQIRSLSESWFDMGYQIKDT